MGHLLGDRAAPSRLAAIVSVGLALTALVGWIFGLHGLTQIIPGAVAMKVNTAAAIVLCGCAIFTLADHAPRWARHLAVAASLLAMLIGLATLVEYVFSRDLGIDDVLSLAPRARFSLIRVRMSPITAATLAALGLAIAALPRRNLRALSTLGAAAGIASGTISLLGYLWNAGELITDEVLPAVALNTASCFVFLGVGILISPQWLGATLDARISGFAAVELKILGGFFLALALLLVGGSYTYRSSAEFERSVQWVAHTQEVRATLASLYGSVAGAELALHDYVLTGETARLDDYRQRIADVPAQLDAIEHLTRDNADQQRATGALRSLVAARLAAMTDTWQAYRNSGLTAARALIAADANDRFTQSVSAAIDAMDEREVRMLAERRAASERVRHATLISLLVTLALASVSFVALFRGIHREMRARRDAEAVIAHEISEVKRTERELLATNRFLDSLFESLPVMVFVKDAESLRYVRLNHACEREAGLSRDAMLGKRAQDLLPIEEAAAIEARDREVLSSGRLIEIPEETVQSPERGARTRYTMKLPIMDEAGTPRYLLGISVDITERKLAEQAIGELNSALLAKAEQLQISNQELESFSYSVSHDLRAPLRAIDGFALMIEEDFSDKLDAEGRRYLAVIRDNSRRMGALIDDLLAFSRLGRLPVAKSDINMDSLVREVVTETLSAIDHALPQIHVEPLPPAHADRTLLRQVWTNLIANAVKYSSKAQQAVIHIEGERLAEETRYSVRDNGVGFNMEYAEKLFGVFQRLHRADEFGGTGVGLAIVHRVVTRHGGRVWAEGKVDVGATFWFALPNGVSGG